VQKFEILAQARLLQRQIDVGLMFMLWRVMIKIQIVKIYRKVPQLFAAFREPLSIQIITLSLFLFANRCG